MLHCKIRSTTGFSSRPSVVFTLHVPLGNIIRSYGVNFHCYADDTQLYMSLKPGDLPFAMETCVSGLRAWMATKFLLLNSDKTEVQIFGPKKYRNNLSNLTLDGIKVSQSQLVKNVQSQGTRTFCLSTILSKLLELHFSVYVTLPKYKNVSQKLMLKNEYMHLLHPDWTIAMCCSLASQIPT